ncbi:integrase/recombinase XerD [Candidatus Magnetomoraceae bacterium gMMP-1]
MLNIPLEIRSDFDKILKRESVPIKDRNYYHKWLRYYWDFCHKYNHPVEKPESLSLFIDKLRQKRQKEFQIKQAGDAIKLYYEIIKEKNTGSASKQIQEKQSVKTRKQILKNVDAVKENITTDYSPLIQRPQKQRETGTNWKPAFDSIYAEIKVRHYSPKTLKSYTRWLGKFQAFTKSKTLESLNDSDIKNFLTFLAVEKNVAASTQNQAFNAILFFYRNVLKKEPKDLKDTVRAKKRKYIPVVLSRKEIDAIIRKLEPPYDLIVKFLYGCGLRLFECLELRIHNFNFDSNILTIHDGKGKKDRIVPLPNAIKSELEVQLNNVIALHEENLEEGYAGTFMIRQLEKKYKNYAKELIWQWFFPAKRLTRVPETGELRLYHLHERHVQKAIKAAVKKAKTLKRVSSHTFRHSFATHLLENNYDIRTIQELLGHSDIRTTMVYTQIAKSRTIKDAKSPLDF